jgi:hypothetical protein
MGHLQAPPSPPRGFFGPGAALAAIAQKFLFLHHPAIGHKNEKYYRTYGV